MALFTRWQIDMIVGLSILSCPKKKRTPHRAPCCNCAGGWLCQDDLGHGELRRDHKGVCELLQRLQHKMNFASLKKSGNVRVRSFPFSLGVSWEEWYTIWFFLLVNLMYVEWYPNDEDLHIPCTRIIILNPNIFTQNDVVFGHQPPAPVSS